MPVRTRAVWCSLVALLLATAACTSSGVSSAPASSVAPTSTAPSTTVASPSPAPSTTTPSPTPTAISRTDAELKSALLSLKDVPSGFAKEKSDENDDSDVSAPTSACKPLVAIMNIDEPRGTKASADVAFADGQDGPYLEETLAAVGTAKTASAFLSDYQSAVKACRAVKISLPGAGTSTLQVREISFPRLGDGTFFARFTATSGPLEGFELIQGAVRSGDVLVGLTFVAFTGSDAEDGASVAVDKVESKLGTKSI